MTADVRWSAASLPGDPGRPNQDRHLIERSSVGWLAAVIDGATSDSAERPNGADYADELAQCLRAEFHAGTTDPRSLLVAAITGTCQRLRLPAPAQPSAAVAIAFVGPNWTRVAVLGDCTAVAQLVDGQAFAMTDDRLAQVAGEARARLHNARDDDPARDQLRAALVTIEREARNAHGGYFIAADEPEAGWEAVTKTLASDQVRGLALATDGAAAGPTRYGAPGEWSSLHDADASEVVDAVRQAEDSDPDRTRWPRSKRHDDATLVIATLR